MSRSLATPLCFEPVSSRQPDGSLKEMARFTCRRCGGHDALPLIRSGRTYNPEATVKRAVKAGWQAEVHGGFAQCPSCVRARAATRGGESPNKPTPITPTAEVITMSKPQLVPTEPKPLTNDQRLKIRALLDKHFDDAAGRYLDGYSDQRIATEVDAPRVHVERIRDAAYGPVRVTPEVEAAEAAIKDLQGQAAGLWAQMEKFKADLSEAEGKMVAARIALRGAA